MSGRCAWGFPRRDLQPGRVVDRGQVGNELERCWSLRLVAVIVGVPWLLNARPKKHIR